MNQRVVSGFSLTVLLLVLIGLFSYQSIIEFRTTADLVARSHYLADARDNLIMNIVSAESEARGFVIVGGQEYLDLYMKAVEDVRAGAKLLREVQHQSAAPELIDRLLELIERRLERLRITIEARRIEGFDAVVGVAGVGKRLMDEMRGVATRIEAEEDRKLAEAAARLRLVSTRATWIIGLGSVLAVVFHLSSTLLLSRAVANRERLERALLEVSEREQRRIGQDLHDGLCQQLTGISLMTTSLLRSLGGGIEQELRKVVGLINGCIEEARLVTRGLHPVPDEPGGLAVALRELVDGVHMQSSVNCELALHENVEISDHGVCSNLYRIAQEAVRNALKHSGAKNIRLSLSQGPAEIELRIEDDGSGLPLQSGQRGLGLGIMKYRASTIGGTLQVSGSAASGTVVHLLLPSKKLAQGSPR
jgi:signal transduction histidine kinase